MAIEIHRREVLNNLIRFKDSLLEFHLKEKTKGVEGERVYRVLMNRHTGDMRFAQKITSLEPHIHKKGKSSPEDWEEVHLIVRHTGERTPVNFEVRDAEDRELKRERMDAVAWAIAAETLDVLNLLAKQMDSIPREMLPEEAVLQDLSEIHLAQPKGSVEELAGWSGRIEREESEYLLRNKAIGSYLLREADWIAASIAVQLSHANRLRVHPYVLTYVVAKKKIGEFLLLQIDQGWIVYSDETHLDRYRPYPSILALLQALHFVARSPIS